MIEQCLIMIEQFLIMDYQTVSLCELFNSHKTFKPEYNFFKSQDKFRSSRPEVFNEKGALRNFTNFSGKHLCQSLVFNKVTGLSLATLLKKKLWHRFFLENFVKFLRTPFHIEHL